MSQVVRFRTALSSLSTSSRPAYRTATEMASRRVPGEAVLCHLTRKSGNAFSILQIDVNGPLYEYAAARFCVAVAIAHDRAYLR